MDYKTRIKIKAEIEDVYSALTNPFAIELWSGYPAKMSTEVNSPFELWGGDISGHNMAFEENKSLVQEWYFGEQDAPSIVTIKLFKQGGKTQLDLLHTNIPSEAYDDMVEGWNVNYLQAVKAFLEVEE
jgi:activator of HSP90 ATPase